MISSHSLCLSMEGPWLATKPGNYPGVLIFILINLKKEFKGFLS